MNISTIASRIRRRAATSCAFFITCLGLGACGGGGGGGGAAPPPPPPANSPPTLTGNLSPSFSENTDVFFFLSVDDADGDVVTITVGNSPDGQFFTLDPNNGEIRGTQQFDFEAPADVNGDNTYEQTVVLSDGTNTVNQTVRVIITNAEEPPVCTPVAPVSVDENATGVVATLTGTDPDAGDDANAVVEDLMVLDSRADGAFAIDAATGVLSLVTPLDAEAFGGSVTFDVTAVYRTNNLFDRCSVSVTLNDLPTRVTSGILLTENRKRVQRLSDLDGGGADEFWVADATDPATPGPVSGSLILGETLTGAIAADGAATIDVAALDAAEAIRLTATFERGTGAGNATSATVVPISDLDSDGVDDLLFMAEQPPSDGLDPTRRPWGYVLFAATVAANGTGSIDLDALGATDGFSLTGPVDFNGSFASYVVADLDGVAGDELVISLPEGMSIGGPEQGLLYVIDGAALAGANGNLDFDLEPTTREFTGDIDIDAQFVVGAVSTIGDLSGDAITELVIRSGQSVAVVPSANLVAATSGVITSLNPLLLDLGGDFAGVADSANLDGDGADELLVVRGDGASGTEHASVAFGAALQPIVASNTSVGLDATNFTAGEYVGITSDGVGGNFAEPITLTRLADFDGDGRDEVAYGQLNDANNDPGSIYIIRGAALAGLVSTGFDIDVFTPTEGTRISPVPFLFTSLSTKLTLAPDIDGDGLPELYATSNRRLAVDPEGVGIVVLSTDVTAALANNELDIDIEALFFDETPP